MKKKMTTVSFHGTQTQEAMLAQVIDEYKNTKGALMPVLQKAQNIYGYLPIEVQKMIADGMEISLEEIYGVVTFYSQFSLNPKGETAISVCLGTACYVKGNGAILEKISESLGVKSGETSSDGKYSLEATRCIGACGLAPVMTINEDVYGRLKLEEIDAILAKYKNNVKSK
ncbi:MAG: NAD(P)H-dependent oxidoreductase subunit E [Oscillospiraceae bacterium]|nr:NAD(P)H-dependent oxidoreductase subunit E [Oscillospiraceae bacterium]